MAAEFPFMPVSTDQFIADTMPLTTAEVGAYFLLLVSMWRAGGALPNDDTRLARFAKLTPAQWRKVKPTMLTLFHVEHDHLTHNGMLKSMQDVRQRSAAASRNAHARWLKTKGPADAGALPRHSGRNANYNQKEEESFSNGRDHAREGDADQLRASAERIGAKLNGRAIREKETGGSGGAQ